MAALGQVGVGQRRGRVCGGVFIVATLAHLLSKAGAIGGIVGFAVGGYDVI